MSDVIAVNTFAYRVRASSWSIPLLKRSTPDRVGTAVLQRSRLTLSSKVPVQMFQFRFH